MEQSKADKPPGQDGDVRVATDNPDPVIRRGQEAWRRLRDGQSWDDWLAVGEAQQLGRHLAMLEARVNEPSGPRYQAVFGEWLRETGFDAVDKATRSRLLVLIEHRNEIEAWRKTLPLSKRLTLNHPNSVWRHWQASTVAGKATRAARPSPVAKLKGEVVRLEDENARLLRAGDDLFARRDTASDIARVIADHLMRLTPVKANQVLDLLPRMVAERRKADADDAPPPPPARAKRRRRTIEDFQRDVRTERS